MAAVDAAGNGELGFFSPSSAASGLGGGRGGDGGDNGNGGDGEGGGVMIEQGAAFIVDTTIALNLVAGGDLTTQGSGGAGGNGGAGVDAYTNLLPVYGSPGKGGDGGSGGDGGATLGTGIYATHTILQVRDSTIASNTTPQTAGVPFPGECRCPVREAKITCSRPRARS